MRPTSSRPPAPETVSDTPLQGMFEFGTGARAWADTIRYDPLEAANHAIGDFDIIGATRALIIERDGKQSGDRSEKPAMFKRICLVDLAGADKNGVLEKIARIDLLNIADLTDVAPRGSVGGGTFPFVSIEDVDRLDKTTIVVANDSNIPVSIGREEGRADVNEFTLLDVVDFLDAE